MKRGVWQADFRGATDEEQAVIVATYPEGTEEIPNPSRADDVWDGAAWVPPAPKTDPELREEWRPTATLSRAEFCIALKRAGVLSAQEAKAAAKGDWPASFAAALAGVADADEAEILWAGVSTVERMHPLLAALQAAAGLTDEQLDALFGWEGA